MRHTNIVSTTACGRLVGMLNILEGGSVSIAASVDAELGTMEYFDKYDALRKANEPFKLAR